MTPQEIDALVSRLAQEDNRDALRLADSWAFGVARLNNHTRGQMPTPDERRFLHDALGGIYLALLTKQAAIARACDPWFTVPQ